MVFPNPDLLIVVWYGAPRDSSISSIAQLATYFRPPGASQCANVSQHGSNTIWPPTRLRQYVKTHPHCARTRNHVDRWTSLASLVQCRSSRRTHQSVATALARSRLAFLVATRPLSAPLQSLAVIGAFLPWFLRLVLHDLVALIALLQFLLSSFHLDFGVRNLRTPSVSSLRKCSRTIETTWRAQSAVPERVPYRSTPRLAFLGRLHSRGVVHTAPGTLRICLQTPPIHSAFRLVREQGLAPAAGQSISNFALQDTFSRTSMRTCLTPAWAPVLNFPFWCLVVSF